MDKTLMKAAENVLCVLKANSLNLATAESCTAGLISMTLCAASEGGANYSSGFVTYDNTAKSIMLGVKPETLSQYTAVSAQAVREMAQGANRVAKTLVALSVSGYAGPEGGEDGTPAGTIWFGWAFSTERAITEVKHFEGDCEEVIRQAALYSLTRLTSLLT
ncbi:CinA family protein [Rahnella bonaserana]|jgi:nicotinamide-nucleotide amidase